MKELKQLVSYVNPTRLRRLAFYKGSGKGNETQLKRLYQAIHEGKVSSDLEASKLLFGNENDEKYAKLKYRLKEQLVNTALLVDKEDRKGGSYDFIFSECRRMLFAAELLRRSGVYHAAFSLAKKTLKQASRAELSEIACRCCDILVTYYGFVKRVPSKRKEYLDKAIYWHNQHKADYDAKLMHDYYTSFYIDGTNFPSGLSTELTDSIKELRANYPDVNSLDFNYYLGFLEVICAMNTARYDEVVGICQQQMKLLESREIYPRAYARSFLLQIISVAISTDNFEAGEDAVKQFSSMVPEGSRAWFRTQHLYIQLAITNQQYDLTVELIGFVTNHKNFKTLVETVKERIILLKAYVYWLGAIGLATDKGENFSGFRLAKFLNSVPEFAKDRQGLHIPVLIVQALWLLHRKQYEKVRERLAALNRYADRYLKKAKGTARTYYFLKAFKQLADADFHKNGFLRRSQKNLHLLKEHPRSKVEQNAEIEIIPYEKLYDLVVERLDLKRHY